MAYNRRVEVEIFNNNSFVTKIDNLDIDFNIERSITLANNTAEFVIYNAKLETRNKILKAGNNIIFKAGYEDEGNVATIFFGTIDKSVPIKSDTVWVTTVTASDIGGNKTPLEHRTVSLSYIAGSPLSQVISDLSSFLGIPVFGIANVTNTLNNGFAFVGTVGGLVKKIENILKQDDNALYFDSNELVIYKIGVQSSKFGVVRITPNSGLIGNVENVVENNNDNKKRIRFTSLMNPKYKPNVLCQVIANDVNGLFICEKVQYIGNNYGGDFFTIVEAVA